MADSNLAGTAPGLVEVEVKKKRGRISNAEKLKREQQQQQQQQQRQQSLIVTTPVNASRDSSSVIRRNLRNSDISEPISETNSKLDRSFNDDRSDGTESLLSETSTTSKRKSGKRFRLSQIIVPQIAKEIPENKIEKNCQNLSQSKKLIVFNPNNSNSDHLDQFYKPVSSGSIAASRDLGQSSKVEPVHSGSIAADAEPESSGPKTFVTGNIPNLPKKRGRKPKKVSDIGKTSVGQTSSKIEKEVNVETRSRRSGVRTESPLTRKRPFKGKFKSPEPVQDLQSNLDENSETKVQHLRKGFESQSENEGNKSSQSFSSADAEMLKAEPSNDPVLDIPTQDEEEKSFASNVDEDQKNSKNDLEISADSKPSDPKKRRGRKSVVSQNNSESNKKVKNLNQEISLSEKPDQIGTSEIVLVEGVTKSRVSKSRNKIERKTSSQVTNVDFESPSDDVTQRKRCRKRKSGNLLEEQPHPEDEENIELSRLDDSQKADSTVSSLAATLKTPKTPSTSRASTTPDFENRKTFLDEFDDIPQLQISPKFKKTKISIASPAKVNESVPIRNRSSRKKNVVNYAMLEDGISLSDDSSDILQKVSAADPDISAVTDTSDDRHDISENVSEESRAMKRRISESGSDSAPLSVLKTKLKSKKRKQKSFGGDQDPEESYVNLQVSNMKAALDSVREQLKESECRNVELEQKLIGLTEMNQSLEKDLNLVSHNAGNLQKEVAAQKKRYETDLAEFDQTKTNLIAIYNGILSKTAEMSQMKICSERILLESNKIKKELECSNKKAESLEVFKSHFLSVKSSLEKAFRADDESNKIRTNFESLSDAEVSEIVSELLTDYVDLKIQFSMEVKENFEKLKAKNEEMKRTKNQILTEQENKLSELRVKIDEQNEIIEDLQTSNSRLELSAIEVEHLKMDRSENLRKLQDLRKEVNSKEAENVKAVIKFNAEVETMKGQFKASYSEKDRQISQLKVSLREKDSETSLIKNECEAKAKQIQKLESELSSFRETKNRDAASRQKELDEIRWARAHILEMDKKVEDLEKQIKKEKELNQNSLKISEKRENEHKVKVSNLELEVRDREEKLKRTEKALNNLAKVHKMATEEVTAERKTIIDSNKSLLELKALCQSEVRKLEDLLRSKEKEINGLKKTIVEYSLKIDMENMVRAESRNVESQDADSHNSELQNIELQEFESQDVGDVSTEDPSREIDLKPNPVDSAVPLFPVLSCNFDLIDQNYTE